ncbi:site-specific integrase [Derxia gummosa]|uniref:Site-specific integrase n=1 Tax=Derxia gummosa DSM 723 TaxID=1121388 RepID=A0A8B6X9V4_9BURK|nr:site-specific integrase [Derxia gummosa]
MVKRKDDRPEGLTLDLPRGVTVRKFKTKTVLQIAFTFDKATCRETLALEPTKSNLRYAANLKAEIDRKIHDGVFVYAEYFPDSPRANTEPERKVALLGDLLDARLASYRSAVENGNLSPATLNGYDKAIKRLKKDWASVPLPVAPSALKDWVQNLGLTPKGARNLITPLRSTFEDALADELIEFDPFDRIPLKKILRETTVRPEYRADPFSAEERAVLLDRAREDERPMIQFWFEVGLRPGELIAAAWTKVDGVHHRLRIDANVVCKVEKLPKTEAGIRDIDLSAAALDALQAQRRFTFLAGGRIWHNPRTGQPWDHEQQIRRTLWEPLCRRAGVRYRSPYQIRHTYAADLLTHGANPWYVAEQLGHADVEMVFRTYGHWIGGSWKKPKTARELHGPESGTRNPLNIKAVGES